MGETDAGPGVVFLSFMRDLAFWREGASRMVRIFLFFVVPFFLAGFHIEWLLTRLFTLGLGLGRSEQSWQIQLCGWPDRLAFWGRGSESTADKGRVLLSGKPDDVRRSLEAAIADVRSSGPKILIIDQLDELLAIFGDEDVTGPALEGMLLSLREVSFSCTAILTIVSPFP